MQLFNYENIISGFSNKSDGNMRVFLNQSQKITKLNRELFFKEKKISPKSLILADLVHDNKVKIVNYKHKGKIIIGTDALITQNKNLCLALTAADCLIIYIYDPEKEVIALVHAGWRGLLKNIIENTINILINNYNIQTKDLKIFISPHIQSCHFEIKKDILKKFSKYKEYIIKKDKSIKVNLSKIAETKLLKKGINKKNIQVSPECTYCLKNKYFSYRRNKDKELETMIAYLIIKNN